MEEEIMKIKVKYISPITKVENSLEKAVMLGKPECETKPRRKTKKKISMITTD